MSNVSLNYPANRTKINLKKKESSVIAWAGAIMRWCISLNPRADCYDGRGQGRSCQSPDSDLGD